MLLTVDLERLRVGPGDLVLDAGCGEGRHCFGCLERGAHVVGLDLDFEVLREPSKALRARATELGSRGHMNQGDAFFLPYRDETFDRVICSEVMEHVHNYRVALAELWRVTKPQGHLAVTVPTLTSENLYLRLGDEYFETPGGHIRIFRPRALARAMADAGFATVGVGFAHAFHTPYWLLRSVRHLPDADRSTVVRRYREFLIRASVSPLMEKAENLLNFVCPKSLILYAEKRRSPPVSTSSLSPTRSGRPAKPALRVGKARPLRICLTSYRGNMRCGGQGVYLWFLARELTRQGFEVDVFVGPPFPDPMPFAREVNEIPNQGFWARWFTGDYLGMFPVDHRLKIFSPLNFYELGMSYLGFLPEPFAFSCRAFATIASRLQRGRRWDLIHDVQCLGYGLLGLRGLGMPVVSTVHHPLSVDRRASFDRDRNLQQAIGTQQFYPIGMQSFVARHIDCVLTSSEWSARQIVGDFGVNPDNVFNVWNGVDTDFYAPDPSIKRDRAELACVGRSGDPNKGIKTLIAALARLPSHVRLTLVDDDDPGNEVFRWARQAGVAERLHVAGRLSPEELLHLYRRAALVVVPSRFEGFGLPAVEAMACGTPVVAFTAGALAEVINLAGGGLVVRGNGADALAQGILKLLERPELRSDMSRRAPARVEASFAWPRVAEATAAVYREVLARRVQARCRPRSPSRWGRTG